MAELLAKLFIKDYQNTKNPSVRAAYGELSGGVGIVVNLLLTIAKFLSVQLQAVFPYLPTR